MKKLFKVSNIDYDTDGEVVDLPKELFIEIPSFITEYDAIIEYLSQTITSETDFCHRGFNHREVNRVEQNIDIHGIYFWGEGITEELDDMFKRVVRDKINKRLQINLSESQFGVLEGNKGTTDIYFHPMSIVVKGTMDSIKPLCDIIVEELRGSDLPISVRVR